MKIVITKTHVVLLALLLLVVPVLAQPNPGHLWSQISCSGCIDSSNILDGTITYSDTNVNSVQRRVSSSCAAGSSIRIIGSDGTVTCEIDDTGSGVGGSGTDNYIPRWNGASALQNSVIYQTDTSYVGIGTTSPTEKLHIYGSEGVPGTSTGIIQFQGSGGGNGLNVGVISASPYTAWLQSGYIANLASYPYPLSLNPLGGNVGIGTTSPVSKLDVNGWAQFVSPDSGSTGGVRIVAPASGNPAYIQFTNNAKSAEWANIAATSSGHLVLNPQGGVGIGTASPSSALQVSGLSILSNPAGNNYNENIRLPAANNGYASIILGAVSGTSGTGTGQWSLVRWPSANSYLFTIRYNNADYLGITSGGNVGIGTTSPGYKLTVAGDIYANGGWLRTSGAAGWYSETYGGGWYMIDTSWIRAYNSKSVYTPGEMQAGVIRANSNLFVHGTSSFDAQITATAVHTTGEVQASTYLRSVQGILYLKPNSCSSPACGLEEAGKIMLCAGGGVCSGGYGLQICDGWGSADWECIVALYD